VKVEAIAKRQRNAFIKQNDLQQKGSIISEEMIRTKIAPEPNCSGFLRFRLQRPVSALLPNQSDLSHRIPGFVELASSTYWQIPGHIGVIWRWEAAI
jgi:hypothetical protein